MYPASGQSTWKLDYPVGVYSGHQCTQLVRGYFLLNRPWRRTGNLFSHTRVFWRTKWTALVWYVDRRRVRRRTRAATAAVGWWRWCVRTPRTTVVAFLVAPHRYVQRYRWGVRSFSQVPPHPHGGRWNRLGLLSAARGFINPAAAAAVGLPGGVWVWCGLPDLFRAGLATVMADLAYRLTGRGERRIRGVALPLLNLTRQLPGVTGASVRCHGRFVRRQRADHQTYRWGRLSRTNASVLLDQGFATAALRFGAVGVTVTVSGV